MVIATQKEGGDDVVPTYRYLCIRSTCLVILATDFIQSVHWGATVAGRGAIDPVIGKRKIPD